MNKFFATFAILISTVCYAQAQDGYIKYHTDSEYRNNAVKVFKGEIVPFLNSLKPNKINVIVGADTITDLPNNSNSYSTIAKDIILYISQKNNFIKSKDGGLIHIDVSSVGTGSDTIRFVSEKFDVTSIVKNTVVDLEAAKIGNSFRLIIPNSPTIFYTASLLDNFLSDKDSDGINDHDDKCPDEEGVKSDNPDKNGCPKDEEKTFFVSLVWWHYLIFILTLGGIGFGVWKFIKERKKSSGESVRFNGGSLSDFAKLYGGLNFLSSINDKVLIPTKSEYDRLSKNEKNSKIQDLIGEKIRIKQAIKPEFGFGGMNNNETEEKENTHPNPWDTPKETYSPPTNFGNNNELSSQLRQMEDKLIREIQLGRSGSNNQNEINRLRNEKTELENKLKGVENDKRNSDLKQMQLQTDKSTLETNLQNANDEKNRVQNEIKELKERVIAVDFLKGYSESVFTYLKYCQQVSSDAYNFFNKISQQNPKQAFAAGHLLMKFQSAANSIPIGDWLRTVEDIKDSGATTNRQLSRSFSQIQNDSDKQKEFQRLLFSEVLTKYSSNLLILAEAFKNLSRFQGSADFANEAQNTFGKHVTEIVNKAKLTGLELKYVSLFESWEKHIGQVEDNGGERSLAYKEITGLEKGAIAEIVSYGVKTSIGDDTKTIIILA